MSRHIRSRIAKLVQDLEEAEEVVLVFQSWAIGPAGPEAREAPSSPQAATPPDKPCVPSHDPAGTSE